MNTVAEMSRQDLINLIEETLERKLMAYQISRSNRSPEAVFASIDRHMWTPPQNAPTPEELIREDRDH